MLFADLEGFTAYAEGRPPAEVIEMLNEYWGTAVPIVLERHGGLIERFAGDAVMVVFNTQGDQPDHARRACGSRARPAGADDRARRAQPRLAPAARRGEHGAGGRRLRRERRPSGASR